MWKSEEPQALAGGPQKGSRTIIHPTASQCPSHRVSPFRIAVSAKC